MNVDNGFLFLNLSNPSQETRSLRFRKQVRSHVTKKQHRQHRIRQLRQTNERMGRSTAPVDSLLENETRVLSACLSEFNYSEEPDARVCTSSRSRTANQEQHEHDEEQRHELLKAQRYRYPSKRIFMDRHPRGGITRLSSATSYLQSAPITPPLEDPVNVLNVHCKKLAENVSGVLYLLQNLIDVNAAGIETINGIPPGSTHTYLMPMTLNDHALLSSMALFCVSVMQNLKGARHRSAAMIELRGYVIARIQESLEDPLRSINEEILAAVSTLMAYEALFGNREAYLMHAKGLANIVSFRGGLHRLGHNGFMESFLIYHDAEAADLAGCEPSLTAFRRPVLQPSQVSKHYLLEAPPTTDEEECDLDSIILEDSQADY